jgi:hypothetical protein
MLMVLTSENQSDCYRSVRQQFRVLKIMALDPVYEGQLCMLGWSTWTPNQSQLGITLPSQTFMHQTGFTKQFQLNISSI